MMYSIDIHKVGADSESIQVDIWKDTKQFTMVCNNLDEVSNYINYVLNET